MYESVCVCGHVYVHVHVHVHVHAYVFIYVCICLTSLFLPLRWGCWGRVLSSHSHGGVQPSSHWGHPCHHSSQQPAIAAQLDTRLLHEATQSDKVRGGHCVGCVCVFVYVCVYMCVHVCVCACVCSACVS